MDANLAEAFAEEEKTVLPQRIRVACILGIGSFSTFALVDPMLVEDTSGLLFARAVIVAVTTVIMGLTFTSLGKKMIRTLAIMSCLAIGGGVITMTHLTGGGDSTYHEALFVCFLGYAALIPWRAKTAGITFAVLVGAYDLVLFFGDSRGAFGQWIVNNAVLWAGAIVSTAAVVVADRLRHNEFQNRFKMERVNEQLQNLNRAKNHFFANISHELRTPLTLILAPIDSLLEDKSRFGEDEVQQFSLIRKNALRLLRLVDDLLELTKLESAEVRLRLEEVNPIEFSKDLIERVRPLAGRKQISMDLDVSGDLELYIPGDSAQLERVLLNILANAVKFTQVGGEISVNLVRSKTGVRFSVRDSGEGIPKDHLDQIFERFHQADPTGTRRHGGTGIGLALAKEIVELHGGKIGVESELGEGTTIWFDIPRVSKVPSRAIERRSNDRLVSDDRRGNAGLTEWHQALRRNDDYLLQGIDDASERRIVPRIQRADRREKILVVEDNKDMSQFLAALLAADYDVLVAPDGEVGLDRAESALPDLIISDVMMPKMNGFELVRRLRDGESTKGIPVILLTAKGERKDRIEARAGGADVYLQKPFQPSELRAAVKSLVQRQLDRTQGILADKELALGLLAEGAAHEILNPLGFLQNALFVLKDSAERLDELVGQRNEEVSEIRQEVQESYKAGREGIARVRSVIENLRAFTRGGSLEVQTAARVNSAIERVKTLVGVRGAGIKIEVELLASRPVDFRSGQLEQAILNLVINAQRAKGEGCEVKIRTWNHENGGVGISVQDNGPGIPEDLRESIFVPFFSTKDHGKGSGLGLSIVRRVIHEHGGTIFVGGDEGATFSIWLPESQAN